MRKLEERNTLEDKSSRSKDLYILNYIIIIIINGGKNMTTVKEAFRDLKTKRYRSCRIKTITLSDEIIQKAEKVIKFLEFEDKEEDIPFGVFIEFVLHKFCDLLREDTKYIDWLEVESKWRNII